MQTHPEQYFALVGRVILIEDLAAYSLETVKMFHKDAMAARYTIPVSAPAREGA